MNREDVFAALFAKVSTCANFTVSSRRFKHIEDVEVTDMPALFQMQGDQNVETGYGKPSKYTMAADLWIYCSSQVEDNAIPPSTVLNPILDAIEATLIPDPVTGMQNLGLDYVSRCVIEGQIIIVEGIIGGKIVAVVPVKIVATQ